MSKLILADHDMHPENLRGVELHVPVIHTDVLDLTCTYNDTHRPDAFSTNVDSYGQISRAAAELSQPDPSYDARQKTVLCHNKLVI